MLLRLKYFSLTMHYFSVNMMVSECNVKYLQLTGVYNTCNQHSAHDASVSRHKLETYGQGDIVMFNYRAGHELGRISLIAEAYNTAIGIIAESDLFYTKTLQYGKNR